MKRNILIFSFVFSVIVSAYGQHCKVCEQKFDTLLTILKKDNVLHSDIERCWLIAKELRERKYTEYIDNYVSTSHVLRSLTKTFADICIKTDRNTAVEYYLKYLELTKGSAEEQRSLSFEHIFVKFPMTVFDKIGMDKELLNSLTWGFLNNRYYGADPYDETSYEATEYNITSFKPDLKPILTSDNCEEIFYKTNPSLKKEYSKYKEQIDYIITLARLELEN